jgi:hypothetical protein
MPVKDASCIAATHLNNRISAGFNRQLSGAEYKYRLKRVRPETLCSRHRRITRGQGVIVLTITVISAAELSRNMILSEALRAYEHRFGSPPEWLEELSNGRILSLVQQALKRGAH